MIKFIKRNLYKAIYLVMFLIFCSIVGHDYYVLKDQPIWVDEFIYLKLSGGLPNYSTDKNWIVGYETFNSININDPIMDATYTSKVWGHPPVAVIIMYPFTVGRSGDYYIDNIQWYRLIYVVLLVLSVILITDIIRRKFGWLITGISLLPMVISQYLISCSIFAYFDGWMILFTCLTLWLCEVKRNKWWKYISAVLLVGTKFYASFLLLPIVYMEYRKYGLTSSVKMLSCCFALIPFLIYQWLTTGNVLYIFSGHWLASTQWNYNVLIEYTLKNIWSYIVNWGLYIHFPLVVGGIILWFKDKTISIGYILLYVIILLLAINGGFSGSHTYPIMIFAIPIVSILAVRILKNKNEKKFSN